MAKTHHCTLGHTTSFKRQITKTFVSLSLTLSLYLHLQLSRSKCLRVHGCKSVWELCRKRHRERECVFLPILQHHGALWQRRRTSGSALSVGYSVREDKSFQFQLCVQQFSSWFTTRSILLFISLYQSVPRCLCVFTRQCVYQRRKDQRERKCVCDCRRMSTVTQRRCVSVSWVPSVSSHHHAQKLTCCCCTHFFFERHDDDAVLLPAKKRKTF